MGSVSVKIIKLNQEKSSYYNDSYGTFVFKLNMQVEDDWMQIFSSEAKLFQQSFYNAEVPVMIDKRNISALADMDGPIGISKTLEILKQVIKNANFEYNQGVERQQKIESKEIERKRNLDIKVKNIIDQLKF